MSKVFRRLIILVLMAAAPLLPLGLAQNSGAAQNQGAPNGGTAAAQAALRILSPLTGQLLSQNFVTVKYELSSVGVAGGSPNFRIQLDGRDPVITTFSEYTFTGVTPGQHTVTVELVDANNTPVANARAEVQFNTAQPAGTPAGGKSHGAGHVQQVSFAPNAEDNLPPSGSALPLLSVIGFGALLGGIASALRTR